MNNQDTRSCKNCVHRSGNDPFFYYCTRHNAFCDLATRDNVNRCGSDLKNWSHGNQRPHCISIDPALVPVIILFVIAVGFFALHAIRVFMLP